MSSDNTKAIIQSFLGMCINTAVLCYILACLQNNQSLQDSAPAEFFAESGKLHRIWKYAQNLAENDVFGLPTT